MVELWCPEVWAHVTSEFPVLFNAAFPNSKKCPIFTLNWEFAGGGLVGGWISLYYLALGKIDLAICKNQFSYLSLAGWWFASSWEKSFWEHLADVTQSLDIWMATAKVREGKICHNLLWHLACTAHSQNEIFAWCDGLWIGCDSESPPSTLPYCATNTERCLCGLGGLFRSGSWMGVPCCGLYQSAGFHQEPW